MHAPHAVEFGSAQTGPASPPSSAGAESAAGAVSATAESCGAESATLVSAAESVVSPASSPLVVPELEDDEQAAPHKPALTAIAKPKEVILIMVRISLRRPVDLRSHASSPQKYRRRTMR
jgi:hypothetical protein